MDGTEVARSAIITGLDKLSRLQQRPFCHYYPALMRDLMTCEVIVLAGVGMGDLHSNTCLHEARMRPDPPKLIIVDFFEDGRLPDHRLGPLTRKDMEIFHCLRFLLGEGDRWMTRFGRWHLSNKGRGALWPGGFCSFLNSPAEFDPILDQLGIEA